MSFNLKKNPSVLCKSFLQIRMIIMVIFNVKMSRSFRINYNLCALSIRIKAKFEVQLYNFALVNTEKKEERSES